MDRFSKTHPVFQFVFFVLVFFLTVLVYNPIFASVSLVGGAVYDITLRRKEALKSFSFVLAIIGVVSLFNFIFAHYGNDVLFTINNTEFTLQALIYGVYQGIMLGAVLIWFGIFSRTFDSEKVIYLFRFAPKIALLFSMVLGFIPRFTKKLEDIREAQLGLNPKEYQTKKERLSQGVSNLSALVSYALESSIITADSMSSRGYNPKAVRLSRYKLKTIDFLLLVVEIVIMAYVLYAKIGDRIAFVFEPITYFKSFDVLAFVLFCILVLLPVIINFVEGVLWKLSTVKA